MPPKAIVTLMKYNKEDTYFWKHLSLGLSEWGVRDLKRYGPWRFFNNEYFLLCSKKPFLISIQTFKRFHKNCCTFLTLLINDCWENEDVFRDQKRQNLLKNTQNMIFSEWSSPNVSEESEAIFQNSVEFYGMTLEQEGNL